MRVLGNLPSRAADNLFWMGRYLERTEAVLRIVRCLCNRLAKSRGPGERADELAERRPIERLRRLLVAWGCVDKEAGDLPAAALALAAVSDAEAYGSARANALRAKGATSILRERLSLDVWQLIGGLEARLHRAGALGSGARENVAANSGSDASGNAAAAENEARDLAAAAKVEILNFVERALHTLAALSRLLDENFNRVAGWSFLDLGKRIERAINTCRFHAPIRRPRADHGFPRRADRIDRTRKSPTAAAISPGAALTPVLDMAMLDTSSTRARSSFQIARIDDLPQGLARVDGRRRDGGAEARRPRGCAPNWRPRRRASPRPPPF